MKTNKLNIYKHIFMIIVIISVAISGLNFYRKDFSKKKHTHKGNNVYASIVGTWINNDDTTFKMVFIDEHTCNRYDSNVLSETDSVVISNTTPQCGLTVPVTTNTSYIQFIDRSNAARHFCYEIIGLTDSVFGISPVDLKYPPSRFHRR